MYAKKKKQVEWRRKKGYVYQADRLETQRYIQDVFEKADNTISVSARISWANAW